MPYEIGNDLKVSDVLDVASRILPSRPVNFNPLTGLEQLFGIERVDTTSYELNRENTHLSLMVQQSVDSENTRSSRITKASGKGIAIRRVPYSISFDLVISDEQNSYKMNTSGQWGARHTPAEMMMEKIVKANESLEFSKSVLAWLTLKHGFVPDLEQFAKTITLDPTEVWNNLNMLELWGVQRPTGTGYDIATGTTIPDIKGAGKLTKFALDIHQSLKKKAKESGVSILGKKLVLCGASFFEDVLNSNDFKDVLNILDERTRQQLIEKVAVNYSDSFDSFNVREVEFKGIIFRTREWSITDLLYGGKQLGYEMMGDKEFMALAIPPVKHVTTIVFPTPDVTSPTWKATADRVLYQKTQEDKSGIHAGIRHNSNVISSFPELVILGKIA